MTLLETRKPRPHINMHYKCCNVYVNIYLTKDETAFAGNCPRCGARASIKVSKSGNASRFWSSG